MEQALRNALQRATQQLRTLLEKEFVDQLAGIYDIRRDEPIQERPGKHLRDGGQLLIRSRLVEAVRHKIAAGRNREQAVDDYVREAAFTTLNRFVALKMLENRGLVQECVSRGDLSSGYKEFTGLAPELSLLPDGSGYRLYLECLFDEIGTGVKVLFDRRDPAALLWPRRQALLDLLAALNDPEIKDAWGQDETIGWVYQYFNSEQERRKMRETPAPRDSHELAVRNQFFTPRYVVEFLADNTLGRTWYEMRRGKTRLADQCRYLVRRPTEIFLDPGQEPPAQQTREDLSQEELIRQPVYVPHREKKDPRDLKILDPACGSGHFLLYCFDLLLTIYVEAWADQQSPTSEITGKTLREDHETLELMHHKLPDLILRHNLWGVDIDPRCAQIAAFALWLRAQRAFGDSSIGRAERPVIRRTNIVVAEPMPGEKDMLEDFCGKLEPTILGTLVRQVFEKMQLAGEAGTLLKIEEGITEAVDAVKKVWQAGPKLTQGSLYQPATRQPVQATFHDQYEGTDAQFWEEAEDYIYAALRDFATQTGNEDTFRRKLFTDDAEEGFAFIDLCRQRYDVVLMNPPFGDSVPRCQHVIVSKYEHAKNDLFATFVTAGLRYLAPAGCLGAITNRTGFFNAQLRLWRNSFLFPHPHQGGNGGQEALPLQNANGCEQDGALRLFVDLGAGVLDALVETACYVIDRAGPATRMVECIKLTGIEDKAIALSEGLSHTSVHNKYSVDPARFVSFPNQAFVYWLPRDLLDLLSRFDRVDAHFVCTKGLSTDDNFRFIRCWWEVPPDTIGQDKKWAWFAKGGEYCTFFYDVHLLVLWERSGVEMSASAECRGANAPRTRQSSSYYFNSAVAFSARTSSPLSARILPKGCTFGHKTVVCCSRSDSHEEIYELTAFLNSAAGEALSGAFTTAADTAARSYESGTIAQLPFAGSELLQPDIRQIVCEAWRVVAESRSSSETCILFTGAHTRSTDELSTEYEEILRKLDVLVGRAYGMHGAFNNRHLSMAQEMILPEDKVDKAIRMVLWALGCTFGRWDIREMMKESAAIISRDPTGALPNYPPVALVEVQESLDASYPIGINIEGIQVDDSGHSHDVCGGINAALSAIAKIGEHSVGETIEAIVPPDDLASNLRHWLRFKCFEDHVKRYSKSRRKAPIYWQLATSSASYSVWLYYHRLNRDSFYKVLNDFVKPKGQHEQGKLDRLRQEVGDSPSRGQREEIEAQAKVVDELNTFLEEVERVTPLWRPDLNDGVLINFAPLWRLVPQHRGWQQECKSCWDSLVSGDYDWSHLAMHLWPERVVPKCRTDASLAIAHGLEDAFWVRPGPAVEEEEQAELIADDDDEVEEEDEAAKIRHRKGRVSPRWVPKEGVTDEQVKQLIRERTISAVKDAVENLLAAPPPASCRAKATGRGAARARPSPAALVLATGTEIDLVEQVRKAMQGNGDGLAKNGLAKATGLTTDQVDAALHKLIEAGDVEKAGAGRGTRYRLLEGKR